jgi:hypothetical protein
LIGVCRGLPLLLTVMLALAACSGQGEVQQPPGVLAPEEPLQTAASDSTPIQVGDFSLEPKADFSLTARVLSQTIYRFGHESALSPVDLLLGWGRMSDSSVVGQLRFSQSGRWGYWRWSGSAPPIATREIEISAANMHTIAAEPWIEHQLRRLRPGQLVRLDGQLVNASTQEGFRWNSSLSRTDTGGGSCELFYVRYLSVIE